MRGSMAARAALLLFFLAGNMVTPAAAQAYPSKPVRLIIDTSP